MAVHCSGRAVLVVPCCQASPAAERRRKGGNEWKKGKVEKHEEEEIYNIDSGWKIPTPKTEEMIEIAGLQVPTRLKQQLKQERKAKETAKVAVPEQAPRLTHKLLQIIGGKVSNKKLLSPADHNVRPMMGVVRGAVFNALQALSGTPGSLPAGRWLDLYSGTGSVGIEALSRGCAEAHFVENDPWVVTQVLQPNLAQTNFESESVIHTTRVETFLQQAHDQYGARLAGGKFDYISVTPPYEAVVYSTLMAQLSESPLVGEDTCIVVEYPLKSKDEMPEECGPLVKIRDRRYGRTHVAIYGASWAKQD